MQIEARTITEIEIVEQVVTKEVIQITLDRKQLAYLRLIIGNASQSERKQLVSNSKTYFGRKIYKDLHDLGNAELNSLDAAFIQVTYTEAGDILQNKSE